MSNMSYMVLQVGFYYATLCTYIHCSVLAVLCIRDMGVEKGIDENV